MKNAMIALALSAPLALSQDLEMAQGHFKSEANLIEELHFDFSRGKPSLVLKLRNRLTGKNSSARVVVDKKTSQEEGVATYAYLEIEKDKELKIQALQLAYTTSSPVDLIYHCGEQPDDKRKRAFPFYVETNCEIEALTLKAGRERK